MIKHYCDRCEKELDKKEIMKLDIYPYDGGSAKGYELCSSCLSEIERFINDKLTLTTTKGKDIIPRKTTYKIEKEENGFLTPTQEMCNKKECKMCRYSCPVYKKDGVTIEYMCTKEK